MPLVPVDPFADVANPEQARRVYELVTKMAPEEGRVFVSMLVHEGLDFDTDVNGAQILAERKAVVAKMRAELAASAISKAAGGQPIADLEERWAKLDLIEKALDLTHEELSRNAKLRTRDLRSGRFQRESRSMDYDDRLPMTPDRARQLNIPAPLHAANAAGDPALASNLTDAQKEAYHQAYLQVADLTHAYRGDPRAFVELRYEGDDEWDSDVRPVPSSTATLPVDPSRTLVEAKVHQIPRAQPRTLFAEAGDTKYFKDPNKGPENLGRRTGDFSSSWEARDDDGLQQGGPALRRLGAGSDLLWDLSNKGAGLPPHARAAVLAGRYVGQFGPDAAKVVGPPADRAAYRYRGTERPAIDPHLAAALADSARSVPGPPAPSPHPSEVFGAQMSAIAARHERQQAAVRARVGQPRTKPAPVPAAVDETAELTPAQRVKAREQNQRRENVLRSNRQLQASSGLSRAEAGQALRRAAKDRKAAETKARQALIEGLAAHQKQLAADATATRSGRRRVAIHGKPSPEAPGDTRLWQPGPVLGYFRSLLPSRELASLQLKSGTTPPSQGVIFTDEGKAIHQSVGFGDDWYVPFNLKSLDALRGGEYVRTRAYGGLTPEDLYTGLTAGARAVTVVSHNGTFTIEFNDTFKGGRRYNDKAVRMVNRYAQLLDTVRAGDVTLGIPSDPDLEQKLRDEVELETPYAESPRDFNQALRAKRKQLLRAPELSDRKRVEVAEALLSEKADELGYGTRGGDKQGVTRSDPAEQLMANEALRTIAARTQAEREAAYRTQLASYERDGQVADEMGVANPADAPVPPPSLDQTTEDVRETLRKPGALGAETVLRELGFGDELDARITRTARQVASEAQVLRLDGRGYETATKALKEQFPYYVHDVYFRPWHDGAPDRDTGYVRPKHNRPAAAMVGLFDPRATPSGAPAPAKYWADSVRHQERKPVPVQAYGDTGSGAATAGSGGAPRDEKAERRDAGKELLRHLREQRSFADGAKIGAVDVGGQDIAGLAFDPGFPAPLAPIYRGELEEEDFDDPKKAPAAEAKLGEALRYLKMNKLVNLDNDVRDKFARAGQARTGEAWRDYLAYPTLDRAGEFKGKGFRPDAEADQVKAAYDELREIKVLRHDPDFELPDKLADLKGDHLTKAAKVLSDAAKTLDRNKAAGRADLARREEAELKVRATGLAMANQLRRNLKAAEARAKEEHKQRPNVNFIDFDDLERWKAGQT